MPKVQYIYGYSQGAVVATEYKRETGTVGNTYVLVANPNRPNGGILQRFNGVTVPILDIAFNGATPLIHTAHLPLLMPLQGLLPDRVLDVLDAPLRVLAELGYDRTDYGTAIGAGLINPVDPVRVAKDLVDATASAVRGSSAVRSVSASRGADALRTDTGAQTLHAGTLGGPPSTASTTDSHPRSARSTPLRTGNSERSTSRSSAKHSRSAGRAATTAKKSRAADTPQTGRAPSVR